MATTGVRRVLGAAAVTAAAMIAGCAVPVPAFSSPYHGSSAPSAPGSIVHTATVSFCSTAGGPVSVMVDVVDPSPNTELAVTIAAARTIRFNEDEDPSSVYTYGEAAAHVELTTIDPLGTGECASIRVSSKEFHNGDPGATRPFSYTVTW